MRRVGVVATIGMLVVGCATLAPTDGPESTSCPSAGADEAAISDRFWEANSDFAPTAFSYGALAEITADSHLIIRGRVVGARVDEAPPVNDPGGEMGGRSVTVGLVAIDEVLKGVPNILEPGAVLVAHLGSKDLPAAELPRGEVVIFLKNYERIRAEFGKGLFNDPIDRFYYSRPNGYQAVFRNLDCVVRLVRDPDGWEGAADQFPAPLDGQAFDDLLGDIRQLVTAQ